MHRDIRCLLPLKSPHYSDPKKTANYIHLRYDVLLNPESEALLESSLLAQELPDVRWNPQGSGISIAPEAAFRLEELWRNHISTIGLNPQENADEVLTPERYSEGAIRRISVNAYERDPRARKACIAYHGTSCIICGFSFARNYGDIGKGFIHVHHLRPLADIGKEYKVDPVNDLIPLCPNCHAMIHRKNPPYSPQELAISLSVEGLDTKN